MISASAVPFQLLGKKARARKVVKELKTKYEDALREKFFGF
jgi:hypothetical protein